MTDLSAKDVQQLELAHLQDRMAQCSCGEVKPSSLSLAFFEYTGEGSRSATEICANCKYAEVAHSHGGRYAPHPGTGAPGRVNPHLCLNFDPPQQFVPHGPWEFDRFYCGHAGWD